MGEPKPIETAGESRGLSPRLPLRLGRYVLVEELGSGGMATVYLARTELAGGLDRLAAIKTIHPHLAKQQSFLDMFLDEARIASRLSHPNVCAVYDFGEMDGTYFLAMEHLLGEPLIDVVNRIVEREDEALMEVLPFLAARIIADASEGLYAAHAARNAEGNPLGIVHRDVSPQNLFVTYEGSVKVVDFGCAKAAERTAQTSMGTLKGKVSYAAPEQLRSGGDVDARTDIWALGVCLWETLTLRPLFHRESPMETAMAVLEAPIPRADEVASWVPPEVADIAEQCLQRDRDARYESARDLGRALRAFIGGAGATLESAELAEWMSYLFADRREEKAQLISAARALAIDAAKPFEPEPVEAADDEADDASEVSGPHDAVRVRDEADEAPDDEVAAAAEAKSDEAASDDATWVAPAEAEARPAAPEPAARPKRGATRWVLGAFALLLVAGGYFWWWQGGEFRDLAAYLDPVEAEASATIPDAPEVPDEDEGEGAETLGAVADEPSVEHAEVGDEDDAAPEGDEASETETPSEAGGERAQKAPLRWAPATGGSGGGEARADSSGSSRGTSSTSSAGTVGMSATERGPNAEPAARTGTLRVLANSGWAMIYTQGRVLGRTPLRVDLAPGRYQLRVLPHGMEPASTLPVQIEIGVEETLRIDVGDPRANP